MDTMGSSRLTDLDRLVLKAVVASPGEKLYGQKKLQKLLFIAHHPQPFEVAARRPLRSLRFKIFKFGPFAPEIYAAVDRLVAAGLLERVERDLTRASPEPAFPDAEDEGAAPKKIVVFKAAPAAKEEISGADEYDLELIEKVVQRWGWLTSDQIEEMVCDRTGLSPDLKARYQNVEWERFERYAKAELGARAPSIPEAYWRGEQAFLNDRESLLANRGEGRLAAYVGEDRVAMGDDELELYQRVREKHGRPPDYIGFVSASGRRVFDAFGT